MNKIGPYENPQETYSYYTLPFCKVNPDKWETRWAGLGETLEGNSLVKSDYAIKFKKNIAVASCAFAMRSPVLMLALLLPGADCRVLNEGG